MTIVRSDNIGLSGYTDNTIAVNPQGRLYVNIPYCTTREQIQTALNGIYFYYELATPTTETGTPFAENLPINDYGMLYWLDSDNNLVGIPQGATIFYPTNYKGFVDDMYSRVDGDSSKYVIDSELSTSEAQRDTIDTQLKNAIGGTLRQCLCVKESLDFDNTAFVDLGTLGWSLFSTNVFVCFPPSLASYSIDSSPSNKIICSKYKVVGRDYASASANTDNAISQKTTYILFHSATMNANQIKELMKGVLLAYEKA